MFTKSSETTKIMKLYVNVHARFHGAFDLSSVIIP